MIVRHLMLIKSRIKTKANKSNLRVLTSETTIGSSRLDDRVAWKNEPTNVAQFRDRSPKKRIPPMPVKRWGPCLQCAVSSNASPWHTARKSEMAHPLSREFSIRSPVPWTTWAVIVGLWIVSGSHL